MHVSQRMVERSLSKADIKDCLKQGYFTERPTIANKPGDLQYRFRMEATVDGVRIAVGAALIPSTRVVVITVFDPTKP